MAGKNRTKQELLEELEDLRRRVDEAEGREEALAGRVRELEALNAAMRDLSGMLDLGALGETFEAYIRGHVPYDHINVSLLKDERHFEHLKTGEVVQTPAPIAELRSATGWVVKHRKPLIRRDILADDRFRVNDRSRSLGIRSDIILPLISRGEVVGTMSLASCEVGRYTEADLDFLQPLADQMAVLVDNARLYRDLSEAYRDQKLIYDRVSDLIFLIQIEADGVYRCVSVNRTYLEVTGLAEEDVVGKRVEEILPEAAAAFATGKYREAIRKGDPIQYEESMDLPGGQVTVETTLTPVLDESGACTALLGVARNISERKQTEQEIIRLERLHALEDMARGVAHNFNNILVGVLGYAQLIEMQSQDPQDVENAREIVESALRAKDLVQRLNLSVGRGGESPPHRLDSVNEIVQEAIETTRPKWRDEVEARGISIEVDADLGDVPAIGGIQVGLHHIMVHLITNAVDAMPEGGKIEISTQGAGEMVMLRVKDGGIGMDEEKQTRIFEPFFTTKQDVGSGLGLSMVYRTVTGWGGRIEVESTPGEGTTFTVLLPVWKEEMADEEETVAAGVGRRGRLLVVDDEMTVRQVLLKGLTEHTLDTVSTGEEVFDRFEKERYDVALIDLGIPGMPGDEVARQIKQIDPRVVTVLISGWDLTAGDPRLEAFDFYVHKPFSLVEIQETVARAMARRKGES